MARKKIDFKDKEKEIREILNKYNGIPSQSEDRKAYANINYYIKKHSDHPLIAALIEEYNITPKRQKVDFEESLCKITELLNKEGKMPTFNEKPKEDCAIRYFFRKYAHTPEVEELKYIFAHSSCYPLKETKPGRPDFITGSVTEYWKWRRFSSYEYILAIYKKYQKFPAPNTIPMEVMNKAIYRWNRNEMTGDEDFKSFIRDLIALGCKEDKFIKIFNSVETLKEDINSRINALLIEHGACAIHYLAQTIFPGRPLPDEFLHSFFYRQLNESPTFRDIGGLGEWYTYQNPKDILYVHYRLLSKCDEEAIRKRVLSQNRNWEENPPVSIEEWEQYGEYKFFVPFQHKIACGELTFDKSFPRRSIEEGKPYFKYRHHTHLKYLDYKLFLKENGLNLTSLYKDYELEYLTPLNLAETSILTLEDDVRAAYLLAKDYSNCITDESGGVYIQTDKGLVLLFAPSKSASYKIKQGTIKFCANAFVTEKI